MLSVSKPGGYLDATTIKTRLTTPRWSGFPEGAETVSVIQNKGLSHHPDTVGCHCHLVIQTNTGNTINDIVPIKVRLARLYITSPYNSAGYQNKIFTNLSKKSASIVSMT
ncbi:hypothetical protein [Dickeya poaceiphila]|uniref:hypothetical protein n=1 Tax=Dickeya poaceiphila TaxID=568768 RepID=UPI001F291CA2|nr:hypothetical protein [Dickeya poaceiphila]